MIELPEPVVKQRGPLTTSPPVDFYTDDQLRTYGDQRAAEAREQMREECVKLVDAPIWITWDVRAKLITLIRKLS